MPRAYTKQQLEEQYQKLPDALKEAIFSAEVAEKLFEIGKKNGLTIEKIGFMAEETGRVILGLTRPSEFVGVLSGRLGVDRDAAQKTASEINRQVFLPLREALKQTHQIEVSEAALQPRESLPPRPAPAPPEVLQPAPPSSTSILRSIEVEVRPRPTGPTKPTSVGTGPATAAGKIGTGTPSIVDLGGLKIPAIGPSGFLSREEVEKIVAEKKPTAPPPPTPTPQPIPRTPLPFSTPPPHASPQSDIPVIDLRQEPKSLPIGPPRPVSPPQPLSPVAKTPEPPAPPGNSIDLRQISKPPAPEKPKPKPWSGYDPYKEPIE